MTLTVTEDLTGLDWDHEPDCERCGKAVATWKATFVCTCVYLICDGCAKAVREESEKRPDVVGLALFGCGFRAKVSYRDLVVVTPL